MGKKNSQLFKQVHDGNAQGIVKSELDALKAFTMVTKDAIKIFAEKNPDFPMDLSFYYEKQTITSQEQYEEDLQNHSVEFLNVLQAWQSSHPDDPDVYCLMAYCLLFGGNGGYDEVRYEEVPQCLNKVLECEERGGSLSFDNPSIFWYLLCYFCDFENWHDNKYGNSLKNVNVSSVQGQSSYSNATYSSQSPSGGCYIATAVYGSYDCPEVWILRRFRDYSLAKSIRGQLFIRLYYTVSPLFVKLFGNTMWFQRFWKSRLDIIVQKLRKKGYDDTPYCD